MLAFRSTRSRTTQGATHGLEPNHRLPTGAVDEGFRRPDAVLFCAFLQGPDERCRLDICVRGLWRNVCCWNHERSSVRSSISSREESPPWHESAAQLRVDSAMSTRPAIRVIPCLQLAGESLVKAKQFGRYRYVGDPAN